jgi:hypothetical protein
MVTSSRLPSAVKVIWSGVAPTGTVPASVAPVPAASSVYSATVPDSPLVAPS